MGEGRTRGDEADLRVRSRVDNVEVALLGEGGQRVVAFELHAQAGPRMRRNQHPSGAGSCSKPIDSRGVRSPIRTTVLTWLTRVVTRTSTGQPKRSDRSNAAMVIS